MHQAIRLRPFEALYNILRSRCSLSGRVLMSFEDFLTFTKIDACHYCGKPISWAMHINHRKRCGYNLDRKDNSLGYQKENCVVCCGVCNEMKLDRTYAEFIEHVLRIAERAKCLSNN
jgi:5-methylcytosine-specific restriction endonuclease McrA